MSELNKLAEYARCLDGCARVLAFRQARVDHGPDYCTCGYMKLPMAVRHLNDSPGAGRCFKGYDRECDNPFGCMVGMCVGEAMEIKVGDND